MTLIIGSSLEKRYRIEKKLGEGNFGAVYQATDARLNIRCAIKEYFRTSDEAAIQFKYEAEARAKLRHPNLPRVTDHFHTDHSLYVVMDFVEGDDLGSLLDKNGKPFALDQVRQWINQICDALIYMHEHNPPVLHRDIKPANIRITPENNAVLVDFGLEKIYEDDANKSTGIRGITPHFAAPEQYGRGRTNAQSDIYSLGATLYFLLTNIVPPDSFEVLVGDAVGPAAIKNVIKNIPHPISDAIERAMQARRANRFKSVRAFKSALFPQEQPSMQDVNATGNKIILPNGMEFMHIPKGKFIMGADRFEDGENVQHIADIPYDYWMARFPVTNGAFKEFVEETSYKTLEEKSGGPLKLENGQIRHSKAVNWRHPFGENSSIDDKLDHPVTHLDWVDVKAFVKWLNEKFINHLPQGYMFRIPSEIEWEKAARGTDGRIYPWGSAFDTGKCNWQTIGSGITTPVGLFAQQGESPYGCVDMFGNVVEFTRSLYSPCPTANIDGLEDESDEREVTRVLRGGNKEQGVAHRLRLFKRNKSPEIWISLGFRVVIAPTPAIIESLRSAKRASVVPQNTSQYQFAVTEKTLSGHSIYTIGDLEFILIPKGKFIMGSNDHNENVFFDCLSEGPQHTVDIPYDYYLARYPVTNAQYEKYCKSRRIKHPVHAWRDRERNPVDDGVSWHDANDYCRWLNELYKTQLPAGYEFSLPSEAEWEKAARGTDGRRYPWGGQHPDITLSNFYGKDEDGYYMPDNATTMSEVEGALIASQPILQNSPQGDSPYGCADMVGNIWEWTRTIGKPYPYLAENDTKEFGAFDLRVVRGGTYGKFTVHFAEYYESEIFIKDVRCTDRQQRAIQHGHSGVGFRVAIVPSVILR
jgi:formylglycine-generating enzyme required for sulfatase activity